MRSMNSSQAGTSEKDVLRKVLSQVEGVDFYLVGGSVRDSLLDINEHKDLDLVAVGVDQGDLMRKLRKLGRAQVTGDSFDVIRFSPGKTGLEAEIAIPRIEKSTGPGHSDFEVVRSGAAVTLEEDLGRRDFTLNAIAENLQTGEVIDPLGGIADLKNNILRAVSEQSFQEDALRILRGVQFRSRFGFTIEPQTLEMMRDNISLLSETTWDRKLIEMDKLMNGDIARKESLYLLRDIGALPYVLPELAEAVGIAQNDYHAYDVFTHCVEVCGAVEKDDIDLRWAGLLHDVGKPGARWQDSEGIYHFYRDPNNPKSRAHEEIGEQITRTALNRLRFKKKRIDRITLLVKEHGFVMEQPTARRARRMIARVGEENINDLIRLREADKKGSGKPKPQNMQDLEKLRELVKQELNSQHAFSLKDLTVNGNDLMKLGVPMGPKLGVTLRHLLEITLENPSKNNREELLAEAQTYQNTTKNM